MFDTFRRHFDGIQGADAVSQFVETWLSTTGQRVQGAVLSTAWMEPAKNGSAFLLGRMILLEQKAAPREPRLYPSVRLEDCWVDREQLPRLIRTLLGDAKSSELPELFHAPSIEHIYSVHAHDAHTAWPETHVRLTCRSNRVDPEWIPAVAPDLPPFLTWAEAATSWVLRRPVKYGANVPYNGQLVIVLPDRRARATSLARGDGDTLRVAIEANGLVKNLELQFVYARSKAELARGVVPAHQRTEVEIPKANEPTQLDVFCVDRESGFVSHRVFSWEELRDAGAEASVDDTEFLDELANGERETVEFKPFVYDSDKSWEIVRSAVAFLNTDGGRVYVGVMKDGRPEGRDGLKKFRSSEDQLGITTLLAKLQQIINDNVKPVPVAKYYHREIAGEPVAIIELPAGDVVYATHGNEILIRKGSTNRCPDPASELPALLARRGSSSGGGLLDEDLF